MTISMIQILKLKLVLKLKTRNIKMLKLELHGFNIYWSCTTIYLEYLHMK